MRSNVWLPLVVTWAVAHGSGRPLLVALQAVTVRVAGKLRWLISRELGRRIPDGSSVER
jgi:hypothetical protein